MNSPVLNIADVELQPRPAAFSPDNPATAERYAARMGQIGMKLGAQKLGYNVTALPPGKRAFPLHNHYINEEMFIILEGTGEIRIGEATHPLRAGDVVACPPGGPETAHQIANTGDAELKYLAVSTRISPEIVDYPDSEKFGVMAELPAGTDGKPQVFRFLGRRAQNVDYWDGE